MKLIELLPGLVGAGVVLVLYAAANAASPPRACVAVLADVDVTFAPASNPASHTHPLPYHGIGLCYRHPIHTVSFCRLTFVIRH